MAELSPSESKALDMKGELVTTKSSYSVYSIRGLPAGLWGESYAVVTAFESAPNELTSEYFLMTKRPAEALHSGSVSIAVTPLPEALGQIDSEFALREGVFQLETLMSDLMEKRAADLSRPELAHLQFELRLANSGNLLSCWMRGQFNKQLSEMKDKTNCKLLQSYLGLLSQVGQITRH